MTPTETIRAAYRARWNRVARAADKMHELMRSVDPDAIDGTVIADVRAHVEDITQGFHEFNAYKNAHESIVKTRGKASR